MKPPYAIGSVPSLWGHAIAYRWRSLPRVRRHRASKPQGSSERVLPWQITMDHLIFASLSHTHYWYEVGMLKVPAVGDGVKVPLPLLNNVIVRVLSKSITCSALQKNVPKVYVWHTRYSKSVVDHTYIKIPLHPLATYTKNGSGFVISTYQPTSTTVK